MKTYTTKFKSTITSTLFALVSLGAVGCSMTPEQQDRFNDALIKALDKDKDRAVVADDEPTLEVELHKCNGRRINVGRTSIDSSRIGSRTRVVSGDTEIDSDDWSELGVRYSLRQNPTNVILDLTWSAQELNRNQTRGDTRFESTSSVVLYKVGSECHGAQIARIEYDVPGNHNWKTVRVKGKQHGYVDAGDYRRLQNIDIKFDAKGRNDHKQQSFRADYAGLVVVLR